jgi:hypothetical protein
MEQGCLSALSKHHLTAVEARTRCAAGDSSCLQFAAGTYASTGACRDPPRRKRTDVSTAVCVDLTTGALSSAGRAGVAVLHAARCCGCGCCAFCSRAWHHAHGSTLLQRETPPWNRGQDQSPCGLRIGSPSGSTRHQTLRDRNDTRRCATASGCTLLCLLTALHQRAPPAAHHFDGRLHRNGRRPRHLHSSVQDVLRRPHHIHCRRIGVSGRLSRPVLGRRKRPAAPPGEL